MVPLLTGVLSDEFTREVCLLHSALDLLHSASDPTLFGKFKRFSNRCSASLVLVLVGY